MFEKQFPLQNAGQSALSGQTGVKTAFGGFGQGQTQEQTQNQPSTQTVGPFGGNFGPNKSVAAQPGSLTNTTTQAVDPATITAPANYDDSQIKKDTVFGSIENAEIKNFFSKVDEVIVQADNVASRVQKTNIELTDSFNKLLSDVFDLEREIRTVKSGQDRCELELQQGMYSFEEDRLAFTKINITSDLYSSPCLELETATDMWKHYLNSLVSRLDVLEAQLSDLNPANVDFVSNAKALYDKIEQLFLKTADLAQYIGN